jgi:nucleotide-binding universal stress UspA family protein
MSLVRILVGDDGSASAATARVWAGRLARAASADLAVASVGAEKGLSAAAGLLDRARDEQAELIVVGRRGADGFPALQLGSTAHQLAEHATVPVAVVPARQQDDEGDWPVTRLAVGVDGSPPSLDAAGWSGSIAGAASAAVWAVHAVEVGPAFAIAGGEGAEYTAAFRAVEEGMDREWCAPLREAGASYQRVIQEGGAAGLLLDIAESKAIDCLVMGRRSAGDRWRMAMGSVAHRVVGFAPCPAVVVPARADTGEAVDAR